jgi:phosphatidylglycerophosphate synthase
VVLATAPAAGRPAAALPWEGTTVLRRLLDQLASLGVHTAHVVTRPAWEAEVRAAAGDAPRVVSSPDAAGDVRAVAEAVRGADGGVVVAYGDIVTHREALAGLLADPRVPTGVLAIGSRRPLTFRIRTQRGRVLAAGSPYHVAHRATGTFLGVLKVSAADLPSLATVTDELTDLLTPPLPPAWEEELDRKADSWSLSLASAAAAAEAEALASDDDPDADAAAPLGPDDVLLAPADEAEVARRRAIVREDVAALLLVGLVRADVHLGVHHLKHLFWARAHSEQAAEQAAEAIQGYDEDKVLLDSAVKGTDGFFTTFFVSPYSKYIARWAARRGFTPNQVTTVSLFIGVLSAAAFATGERWGLVAGAILLQLAFTTDCVDGQLARYTRTFSKLGAWLDSIFDRSKEYLVFAGLAIGASRTGDPVWVLAGAALTLQTMRHTFDFSFAQSRHQVIAAVKQQPLAHPNDFPGPVPAARTREQPAEPVATAPAAPPPKPGLPRRILRLWRRLDRMPGILWLKRVIAFPIGERFAAISITAALWDARTTFTVLLVWGTVAALYTLPGRILRAILR